jgi:hypothetical protein
VDYHCTIQLFVEPDGTIVRYFWTGNAGGCATYARLLGGVAP